MEPIYLFCADFFTYIGATLSDDFGGADSLSKLGPYLENLSRLVPNPRAVGSMGMVRVYLKGLGKAKNSKNVVFHSASWARLACMTEHMVPIY